MKCNERQLTNILKLNSVQLLTVTTQIGFHHVECALNTLITGHVSLDNFEFGGTLTDKLFRALAVGKQTSSKNHEAKLVQSDCKSIAEPAVTTCLVGFRFASNQTVIK